MSQRSVDPAMAGICPHSLPKDCIIIAGLRGNEVIIPKGDTVFREGDSIIVLIKKKGKEAFKRLFLEAANFVKQSFGHA